MIISLYIQLYIERWMIIYNQHYIESCAITVIYPTLRTELDVNIYSTLYIKLDNNIVIYSTLNIQLWDNIVMYPTLYTELCNYMVIYLSLYIEPEDNTYATLPTELDNNIHTVYMQIELDDNEVAFCDDINQRFPNFLIRLVKIKK